MNDHPLAKPGYCAYGDLPTRPTNRRRFLAAAGLFLARGALPAPAPTPEKKDTSFRFVALNDTHVRDHDCVAFLRKAIAQIHALARKEPIDFAILAGDIAMDGRKREFDLVAPLLKEFKMPVYAVPGNHDFKGKDRSAYDRVFPKRLNYSFTHKGWQFVGFDSTNGPAWSDVSVTPPVLSWLKAELARLDKKKPLVAFTHFPLGKGVKMRLVNAEAVLELFRHHNLVHVISGHFHGITKRRWRGATLTTNRCLAVSRGNHDGSPEKGFFLLTAAAKKLAYRFAEVKP